MKSLILVALAVAVYVLSGCSHNQSLIALGERTYLGFGPPDTSASYSSTKGLMVADNSRENSGFTIKVDSNHGVAFDTETGTLKGVSEISQYHGVQITGYLVKLAKASPELAKLYVESALAQERLRLEIQLAEATSAKLSAEAAANTLKELELAKESPSLEESKIAADVKEVDKTVEDTLKAPVPGVLVTP